MVGWMASLKNVADYYLREFACANERHPWDVRVKVGSERKFASSDTDGGIGIDTFN